MDVEKIQATIAKLSEAGQRSRPVERPGERAEGHQQALARPGRAQAHPGPAATTRRPRSAVRTRRRGPGHPGRGAGGTDHPAARDRRAGGPDAAVRRVRRARSPGHHPVGSRRGRRRRLRRDADADVSALVGAARLPHRGLRHVLRGRGRDQVRDLPGQGPLRLRHPLGRAGHPPTRPHLPVRQPGPPADLLRRGRGRAGRRDQRPRRDRREGTAGRRLPLVRARADRASTPPTPRSGSPTSPPGSWCPARTSARRSRTAPRR